MGEDELESATFYTVFLFLSSVFLKERKNNNSVVLIMADFDSLGEIHKGMFKKHADRTF